MNHPSATTATATVIPGDCLKIMPTLRAESVDLIVTDPPYLCRYLDRTGRGLLNDDNGAWLEPAYREAYRLLKRNTYCVTFYGWHEADKFIQAWRKAGFRLLEHLVFVKQYDSSCRYVRRRHEQAYLLAKGIPPVADSLPIDVIPWQYTGNKLHPTQKPVSVLASLIEAFSPPGGHVLDPFCGSGSTLVAARGIGRTATGIELDPAFARVAEQRLGHDAPRISNAA
jgi:site-specific DNA-methyltransferase (adenine-specific)